MNTVWTLFKKDMLLEFRQQYAVYGVLLYIVSTVFVLYLSMGSAEGDTWIALFWVMQLFVCINAVAKSFLQDSRGRMLYYYTITSPTAFVFSKILYNLLLMAVLNTVTILMYIAFMGDPTVRLDFFIGITFLGSIGLSLVFTMLAAIASKAMQQASLMAILGFPVIIPQLLLLVRLSKMAFAEAFQEGVPLQISGLLLALDTAVVILAVILFPFLWKD